MDDIPGKPWKPGIHYWIPTAAKCKQRGVATNMAATTTKSTDQIEDFQSAMSLQLSRSGSTIRSEEYLLGFSETTLPPIIERRRSDLRENISQSAISSSQSDSSVSLDFTHSWARTTHRKPHHTKYRKHKQAAVKDTTAASLKSAISELKNEISKPHGQENKENGWSINPGWIESQGSRIDCQDTKKRKLLKWTRKKKVYKRN